MGKYSREELLFKLLSTERDCVGPPTSRSRRECRLLLKFFRRSGFVWLLRLVFNTAAIRNYSPAGLPVAGAPASLSRMTLPYKIATLLYCFNEQDEVLLLERAREPNRGLWSPCGGKLHTETGESPYVCGCREAWEEMGVKLGPGDLHLTGILAERGYEGQSHWLLFLFEVKPKLTAVPPPHREGRFQFFSRSELPSVKMPQTDVEQIWPLFWKHRGGFFAADCECGADGRNEWTLEESVPAHG